MKEKKKTEEISERLIANLKSLKGIFREDKDKITLLDIADEEGRIFQVRKRKKEKIELSRIIPFSLKEDKKNLTSFFKTNKISINNLVISLPHYLTFQRYLSLPSTDPVEIRKMVNYQLPDLTPYTKEEITFDYHLISEKGGYSKLLLVIARQKEVSDYLSPLHTLGLEPEMLQLSSAALANWFLYNFEPLSSDAITSLIDFNPDYLDIIFLKGKNLIGNRSIRIKDKEDLSSVLLSELNQGLLLIKENLSKGNLGQIFLCGEKRNQKEISRDLENSFKVRVEILDPLGKIGLSEELKKEEERIKEERGLPRILGQALSMIEVPEFQPVTLNLLPIEEKKKKEFQTKQRLFFKKVFLVLIIFFLLLVNLSFKLYKREREARLIIREIKRIKPLASRIQRERKRLVALNEELGGDSDSLDILAELYQITPKSVLLSTFSLETGKVLILRGEAQELSVVFDYVSILENSPSLENIRVNYATRRRVGQKEVVNFELYCHLGQTRKR